MNNITRSPVSKVWRSGIMDSSKLDYETIFAAEMKQDSLLQAGRGPLLSTRSTVTNVLDTDGIWRSVSASSPAPIGIRYISADTYSRYDVSGNLLSSAKGFVCGPQRQNLVSYSEDANQWTEVGTCTVSSSGTIGGISAFQLTGQTAIWHRRRFLLSGVLSGKYSFSVHCASGNQNNARITITDATDADFTIVDCNAATGAITSIDITAGTFVGHATAVDGGYRFDIVFTPATDGHLFQGEVGTGTATASHTIIVTGAQVEAGNAATAYIKTTGSAVTRTADTHTIPISNFRDEMTVTFKWTPHFNYNDLPAGTYNKGIITPTTASSQSIARYNRPGTGTLSIKDSSLNESLAALNWTKDTTYNVCTSFSKARGLQGICVAGVDSGDGTHAGFTLASVITFGLSSIEEFTIADVQFKPGWSNAATRAILAPA